ncbi:hypothetical protein [Bartonella schoenbuchensis]
MLQAEVLQTQAAAMIQQAEKQAQDIRIRQEFNMQHKDYADKL